MKRVKQEHKQIEIEEIDGIEENIIFKLPKI